MLWQPLKRRPFIEPIQLMSLLFCRHADSRRWNKVEPLVNTRRFFRCVALAGIGLGLLGPTSLLLARADPSSDVKELADLGQRFQEAKDGAAAQAQFKTFLTQHGDRDGSYLAGAYGLWTQFQLYHLQDSKGALSTVEEARAKFAGSDRGPELDGLWAAVLLNQNRPGEVETFYDKQWPKLVENRGYLAPAALSYGQALEAQGKNDKAVALWRQTFQLQSLYMIETQPGDQVFNRLVEDLLRSGHNEEALSWAKLNYMVCSFDDGAIGEATKLLMRTWTANDLTSTTAQAFLKSQQDPAQPNPLAKVAVPAPDIAALQKQKAAVQGWHARRLEVTDSLLSGNWRQAMLQARLVVVDNPGSPEGVLEVCRVFKAADLNLKRANEFIAFMKSGTGDNPMIGFLKEHPDTGVPNTDAAPAPANPPVN